MKESPPLLLRPRARGPLKTKVLHATVLGHQEIALRMFAWLEKLAKTSGCMIRLASLPKTGGVTYSFESFSSFCKHADCVGFPEWSSFSAK